MQEKTIPTLPLSRLRLSFLLPTCLWLTLSYLCTIFSDSPTKVILGMVRSPFSVLSEHEQAKKTLLIFPFLFFLTLVSKGTVTLRPKLVWKVVCLVLERVTSVISNICSLSSAAVLMLQVGGGKSWLKFSHHQVFDCASPDWTLHSTNSAL